MSNRLSVLAAVAGAALLAGCVADSDSDGTADSVTTPEKVKLGVLTCKLADVDNLIVYAQEEFACVFEGDGRASAYTGTISKFGANLEIKGDQTLAWAVLAPVRADRPGVLEGDYAGVSAEAALGYGAGAKVLVGGSGEQITLQPLSVSASSDSAGLSLTVDALELKYQGNHPMTTG